MFVGVIADEKMKRISQDKKIAFADLLEGFGMEDLLRRIYESVYKDYLCLINSTEIGLDAYAKTRVAKLDFYYMESGRYIPEGKVEAGGPISEEQLAHFWETILSPDESYLPSFHPQIVWSCEKKADNCWDLKGEYKDMHILVTVHIYKAQYKQIYSQKITLPLFMEEGRKLSVLAYGQEYQLAEMFYEVMDKLELISDMKVYDEIYNILCETSVSGRRMMENMLCLTEKNPRMLTTKRMEQFCEYRDYAYMQKRWKQYEKRRIGKTKDKIQVRAWEDVIDKLICFMKPIWEALCNNEIFIDDWMADLSRFMS